MATLLHGTRKSPRPFLVLPKCKGLGNLKASSGQLQPAAQVRGSSSLPIANKSLTSAGPARHHNEGSNGTAIPVEIIKSSLKMKLWGRVHMKQILALKSLQYILYFS